MKSIRFAIALGVTMFAAAPAAQAQLRRTTPTQTGRYPSSSYPTSANVPAGMCQVWINGLPANQQPAPTDCATARANAPANSRIIYGPGTNGTNDPRYPRGTYDPRYPGQNGRGDRDWKREKEREKAERKAERKQKHWDDKGKRGKHDDDDDRYRHGSYGDNGGYGRNSGNTCLDANRDGICDYRQRSSGPLGSIARLP